MTDNIIDLRRRRLLKQARIVASWHPDDAIARATELLQQHASSPVMRNAQGKQTNGPAIEGDHGDDWTVRVANNVGDLGISCETCFELMRDHFNDACVPVWPLEGSKSLRQRREGIELGNPRYTGHPLSTSGSWC